MSVTKRLPRYHKLLSRLFFRKTVGWEQAVAVLTVALSLEVAVAHSEN